MRHIYLLRHAHAIAGDADMADHLRPLSPRGHGEAETVSRWLADQNIVPDLILCSTAARTEETAARVLARQQGWPAPVSEAKLYLASPGELLHRLQTLPEDVCRVLVIGHNPGLHELALLLTAPVKNKDYDTLELGLATGGVVKLELKGAWVSLAPGSATFSHYFRP